jgi:hypothetical protein
MGISYSVTSITGSPMVINSEYTLCTDSLIDLLNNSNASPIAAPLTLGSPNNKILLLKGQDSVTIAFTPSTSIDDGQGFHFNFSTLVEITAVSGTVKFIADKFLKMSDDSSDAWSNPYEVTPIVGSIVGSGFILCDKYGSFSIKISAGSKGDGIVFCGDNGSNPIGEVESI